MKLSDGNSTLINEQGYTEDIVCCVLDTFKKFCEQGYYYVDSLKGDTDIDTLHNIANYVCNNITYKVDPDGVQLIKTPHRLIDDGFGDCKSYSIFICSILSCIGIKNKFRFAGYNGSGEYTHVYPIAIIDGKDYVIDCVAIQQNKAKLFEEVNFTKMKDVVNSTRISVLSGLSESLGFTANDSVAQIVSKCFRYYKNNSVADFLDWIIATYKNKEDLDVVSYVFSNFYDSPNAGLETMKSYCKSFISGKNNPSSPYQVSELRNNVNLDIVYWFNRNITNNIDTYYNEDCTSIAEYIIDTAICGLYLFLTETECNEIQKKKKKNADVYYDALTNNTGLNRTCVMLLISGAIKRQYNTTPISLLSKMFDKKYKSKSFIGDSSDVWSNINKVLTTVSDSVTRIFGAVNGGATNFVPQPTDVSTSGNNSFLYVLLGALGLVGVAMFSKKRKK